MKALPSYVLGLGLLAMPALRADLVSDLTAKADAGDPIAQVELGNVYAKGEGAAKNLKDAAKWYAKAAEQGNLEAQLGLGAIYIKGQGVPKDSREAAKWYLKAAEQGNADAQCQVARMHMAGAGVPKDDVEAYKWSSVAAAQGNPAAKTVLMVLEKRMTKVQVAKARELSRGLTQMKKGDAPGGEAPPVEPIPPEVLEPEGN